MGPGNGKAIRPVGNGLAIGAALGPWLLFLAGCACCEPHLDQQLQAQQPNDPAGQRSGEHYHLACPDVLEWTVADHPEMAGKQPIGPDGRIELGSRGPVRVEGQEPAQAAGTLARQLGVPAEQVHLQVAEFNSQQVYLFGQVAGLQRAVAYRGDETLLELLQRAGGLASGAAPNDIYVVRTQVADGKQPEVFHIALRAALKDKNHRSNIHMQPFDQVYVGETRRSNLKKCVPPCLRPLYQKLCGLHRPETPLGPGPAVAAPADHRLEPAATSLPPKPDPGPLPPPRPVLP